MEPNTIAKQWLNTVPGAKSERPGLKEALEYLRDGEDVLMVVRNTLSKKLVR